MDEKNKLKNADKLRDRDWLEIGMEVVSATEVTGMVSTPPLTEGQVEGYRDLFTVRQKIGESAQKASSPQQQEKMSDKPT